MDTIHELLEKLTFEEIAELDNAGHHLIQQRMKKIEARFRLGDPIARVLRVMFRPACSEFERQVTGHEDRYADQIDLPVAMTVPEVAAAMRAFKLLLAAIPLSVIDAEGAEERWTFYTGAEKTMVYLTEEEVAAIRRLQAE